MMTVSILLSGRLKIDGYGQGHPMNDDSTFRLALREGSTVRDVISGMGVPSERVTMTMINGRSCRADGLSNREIADKLFISIRTVKKHVENIHGKLGAKSRTQAVAQARELRLL